MKTLVQDLEEQISIDKELIDVLPKTGVKQIRELKKKLSDMIEKYDAINQKALEEITLRYNKITGIKTNEEIAIVSDDILKLDNLVLSEKGKTSFERMKLDKLTYKINGYYKKNLEIINQDIMACIDKFQEVGIKLTGNDFQISEYANEYMTVLLEEAEKGNINSDRVKENFEKIYWKSSDLIVHILVNIRQIYDINENAIDKYYKNKTEEVFNNLNVTEQQVENKKEELAKKLNVLKGVDAKIILDSFTSGLYSIGDYRQDTYVRIYENIVSKKLDDLSSEEKLNIDENFKKLNNNLVEYTNYLEFKFIIDEIFNLKKIREKENEEQEANKDKKKKTETNFEITKKEINKLFEEIKKINTEIKGKPKRSFFFFFRKKALPKNNATLILERDNKVLELKELYFNFDNCKLKETIIENIIDTSKIYDVFRLASYNYGFLARTIIKKYPDILEADIDKMIERFIKFIRLYPFSVLNNVNIYERKDIAVVIKDKHKLLGLEISKENFTESNLPDFAKQTQIIDYYNDIAKSEITVDDIQFVLNARTIIK